MRRSIQFGLLVAAGMFLAPSQSWAAEPTTGAVLSVAGSPIQFQMQRDMFFQDRSDPGAATGTLLVSNTGTHPARHVSVTGFYSDGQPASPVLATPDIKIPAGETTAISLSMTWSQDLKPSGVLTIGASGAPPVTVAFQIKEVIPGSVLTRLVLWSAVLAALTCLAAHFAIGWGLRPPGTARPKWKSEIDPIQTWTFSGSWASNLTALGAILGTVLAATGFLSDAVPGVSTGMFVALSLLFGFLVLVAPVIFMALYNRVGKPTYVGLLIGATFTLWAAIGELASAAQLTARAALSPAAQVVPWVVVIVLVLILGAYTRTSLVQVLHRPGTRASSRRKATAAAEAKAAEIDIPLDPRVLSEAVDAAVDELEPQPVRTAAML